MAVSLDLSPSRTQNAIVSRSVAGRTQVPFLFTATDFADKSDYRIQVEVLDDVGTPAFSFPFVYRVDSNGRLFVDLANALEALSSFSKSYVFAIRYQELFEGSATSPVTTEQYQAIFATINGLQADLGANMWDYLLKVSITYSCSAQHRGNGFVELVIEDQGTETNISNRFYVGQIIPVTFGSIYPSGDYRINEVRFSSSFTRVIIDLAFIANTGAVSFNSPDAGKFLTAFPSERKKDSIGNAWRGWAFNMYYLIDNFGLEDFMFNRIGFNSVRAYGGTRDINGGQVDAAIAFESAIILGAQSYINKVALPQDFINNEDAFYIRTEVREADFGSTILTARHHIQLQPECRNPIMIEWLNTLGGYDQWLFSINQTYTQEEGQVNESTRANDQDVSLSEGLQQRLPLTYTERAELRAESLTLAQIRALATIKRSTEVYVWLTKDGSKKILVRTNASTAYQTDNVLGDFVLDITMPDNFYLLDSLEY